MSQAADGHPTFAISIHPGDAGGSALVQKQGLDPRSSALLRHERDVLSHLSHPNIIELAGRLGPTASDDTSPLVTFLAGRSTLADHPPVDPMAVTRAAAQLATTLAELHDLGWAHGAITAEHLIVTSDGSIVWCSFRRAVIISTTNAPAATADVDALVLVIESLLPTTDGRVGVSRRLGTIVAAAKNRTPTARRLADELAVLLGDQRPQGRRSHSRSQLHRHPAVAQDRNHPASRPRHARRDPRSPAVGIGARLSLCVVAGMMLWRLAPPAAHAVGSTSDLPPALRVVIEVVRWAALTAAGYGIVINGLTLVAVLSRSKQLAAAAGRLGPSVLRRWATGITSVGLLGTAIVSAASSSTPAAASHIVMTPAPDTTSPPSTTSRATPTTTAPTTPATTTTTTAPDVAPAVVTHPSTTISTPTTVPQTSAGADGTTWVTDAGDDLWHIAERTLATAWNRPPSNAEIGRYWQRLLEANRHHLSNPDQPDLIYAGQVFDLPSIDG